MADGMNGRSSGTLPTNANVTSSIVTSNKGVEAQGFNGRGRLELVSSDIRAPQPLVGSTLWEQHGTTLSAIPSWLAVAGAVFRPAGLAAAHRAPAVRPGVAGPAPA